MYEIDHLFICAAIGAPEAERLIACGLTEGPPNRHPGQGTANRRFFFDNAMLELLWVENAEEARSPAVRRLGLWERWHGRHAGASPFGLCYRPVSDATLPAPFDSWRYQPSYAPIALDVATTSVNFEQPLLFYLPHVRSVDRDERSKHAAGMRNLSSLVLNAATLELTFDEARQGRQEDFHPDLPLLIRW